MGDREAGGRAIYESQRARLKDRSCLAANRPWRSKDVPDFFWEGYCLDADAVYAPTQATEGEKVA